MGCGCNQNKVVRNLNNIPVSLRQAAARSISPRSLVAPLPFATEQPSPAMDMERRRIERLRREAIKRTFNR